MSFSSENKLTIGEILEINQAELEAQLTILDDGLTAEVETYVIAKIALWNSQAGGAFASFTATESNQGFNLNAEAQKNAIRMSIAVALGKKDWAESFISGSFDSCGTSFAEVEVIF